MAEEGSEGSVANSSSTTNLWELHGNNSLSSWNNVISWRPPNPNSNSSCEEDISMSNSFTNTSNHSGLSEDSSRRLMEPNSCRLNEHHDYTRESASDSHLWNQVLLSVGSSGDMGNNQDVGENFLETFPSKNLASVMFEPACDYLKKMDSGWGYANSATLNIERQLNSFNGNFLEPEKLNNLSNLVSNWSIAPPYPDLNRHIIQQPTRDMCLDADYSEPDLSQMKPTLSDSSSYGLVANGNSYFMPSYDMKDIQASDVSLNRSLIKSNNMRNHMSRSNGAVMGDHNKYYYGMADPSQSNTRNLSDVITFNGSLNKPLIDPQASSKPCQKDSNSMESKKQVQDVSSQARGNSRGTGVTSEGKKKRTEDNSETQFKKPKHETVSSVKVQAPKVKLGDRITALQQIVSPFGKTDTASVLQEAIGYIKFLQEQVQLLSNPYMKSNANKDPWGMLERKDKAEMKLDLKSRGLCLVPISCTPQMYRENTGSDYWTPTYRGCLYR